MKAHIVAIAGFIFLWICFINGCSKWDLKPVPWPPPPAPYQQPPILTNSFTQEFDTFTVLTKHGWGTRLFRSDYVSQGWEYGNMKVKPAYIGNAYSFRSDPGEYVYAGHSYTPDTVISMWMFTPPVEMKNGDRISFYTVDDTLPASINRLQVRLNPSDTTSDVGTTAMGAGQFTYLISDINRSQLPQGYPQNWTKMEYTISGLPGTIRSRIAFRYFIYSRDTIKAGAIGVDLFQFVKS
ncbi:MAG: choice-of-anchor J domain-containing protein [Candidatus Dadabacteria bacterium]